MEELLPVALEFNLGPPPWFPSLPPPESLRSIWLSSALPGFAAAASLRTSVPFGLPLRKWSRKPVAFAYEETMKGKALSWSDFKVNHLQTKR